MPETTEEQLDHAVSLLCFGRVILIATRKHDLGPNSAKQTYDTAAKVVILIMSWLMRSSTVVFSVYTSVSCVKQKEQCSKLLLT